MAIDVNELSAWVSTPEGGEWLDGQKAALVLNRDEVLGELKKARSDNLALEQQYKESEQNLQAERQVVSKMLIDDRLAALLKDKFHVFEQIVPDVANRIKQAYGLSVQSSGLDRTVCGTLRDGEGKETTGTLDEVLEVWRTLPESLGVMRCVNSGGGAIGNTSPGTPHKPALNSLSGRELAGMSDSEFNNMRQQTMRG